ncbi:MAG: PQQ-binding-like beta-propeller repeat protein [Bryobacteraceae bacterium]
MRKLSGRSLLCGCCLVACAGMCHAQFGRGDSTWATTGADAQRSSWVRTDPKISKEGVTKPDFRLLWKLKLGDSSQVNSFTPAVLLTKYIGYRGFRDLALVENNNDKVYGIDVDLGRIEWTAPLKAQGAGSCAGDLTAGLARPTVATFPSGMMAAGPGRGGPAHSAVGEPDQGGVTLAQPSRMPTPPPAVAQRAPAALVGSNAPGEPGSGGPAPAPKRPPITMHVVAADGMVHTMYVSNGIEAEPPIEFLPPGSAARGFIVLNNTAYAALNGCGGGAGGVRALDLTSKQLAKWDATTEIAGSEGPAFGPDGTLFVTTAGGEMVALDGKTLDVKEKYTAKQPFITSPVVFQFRQRVLAVAAAKDGSLQLLDTKSLGGDDHQTPLASTPGIEGNAKIISGALATFQDVGGRRWILAPVSGPLGTEAKFTAANGPVTRGAIAAWQVSDANGTLSLVPGWISRDLTGPSVPMIVNGVIFAVSNGDEEAGAKASPRSSPAAIYAFDGNVGKELWNSGKVITAPAHHGRLSAGGSQLYLGTDDGTFYAFGSWIERQ